MFINIKSILKQKRYNSKRFTSKLQDLSRSLNDGNNSYIQDAPTTFCSKSFLYKLPYQQEEENSLKFKKIFRSGSMKDLTNENNLVKHSKLFNYNMKTPFKDIRQTVNQSSSRFFNLNKHISSNIMNIPDSSLFQRVIVQAPFHYRSLSTGTKNKFNACYAQKSYKNINDIKKRLF